MELLLASHKLSKSYGTRPLFDDLSFGIKDGDKIGLIGANGSGKSTLVKVLSGLEEPDSGDVTLRGACKIAYVPQEPEFELEKSIFENSLDKARRAGLPEDLAQVDVSVVLSQLGFADFSVTVGSLSGGWQKRLAIAQAVFNNPDLIFFDEPTNHLDWEGIVWLENYLQSSRFSWLMISHDRYLLNTVTKKIFDLDPFAAGRMIVSPCAYDEHLFKKQALIEGHAQSLASMENKLRREDEWLKRGPKARATKAKSRIEAAGDLKKEIQSGKERQHKFKASIDFTSSGRKSKKLIESENMGFSYASKKVFDKLTLDIGSKTTIGILGANGVGKSSLLKVLSQKASPTEGRIRHAEGLKIVNFEQNRESLPLKHTLKAALSDQGDQVIFRGSPIHLNSWAKKFGFSTEKLLTPVEKLSGGEQARLLISRLMLQEADVLILDEPTNDLDIQTLEILEDALLSFSGAVIVVSHDRYLLERVSDYFLGFDGQGGVLEFASVGQWQQHLKNIDKASAKKNSKKLKANKVDDTQAKVASTSKSKKLSFKEQREFDSMEKRILEAESKRDSLQLACADPKQASDASNVATLYRDLGLVQEEIESLYRRWEVLGS